MTDLAFSERTLHQLLDLYIELGVQQNLAEKKGQTSKFNQLAGRLVDICNELKGRSGDQRRLLLKLFDHPDMQVRLNAAQDVIGVAPIEARQQLESIANSNWFPQAGVAGMTLDFLDGKLPR